MADVPPCDLAVDADALSHLHHPLDDLDARRLQQRLSAHRGRAGRSHPRARHARYPLPAARRGRPVGRGDRVRAAAGAAIGLLHDETAVEMSMPSLHIFWLRLPSLRAVATEAKLLLIGIPVLLWTMLPIYHLFLFAISPKESAFAGNFWPTHPTLRN